MERKRRRSPSPPRKIAGEAGRLGPRRTIDDVAQNQEVFLRVLSFLSAQDLVNVQGVSRYWARMSLDPQLWKQLYLSRYPHPHHSKLIYRPSSPSTRSRALRPIARLPSRAFPPPSPRRSPSSTPFRETSSPARGGSATPTSRRIEGIGHATALASRTEGIPGTDSGVGQEIGFGVRNDGVDWKMMLRLGTNWSNGNALSQATIPLPPSPSPSAVSQSAGTSSAERPRPPPYSEQHVALFPTFIFTSNPLSPLVQVYPSSSASKPLSIIPPPPGWSSPSRPDNVTAICADQAVAPPDEDLPSVDGVKMPLPARLAVFYESGGFVVLRVRLLPSSGGVPRLSWVRESVHPAHHRPKSLRRRATTYSPLDGDSVVLAAMHYPVLLTCTLAFHLSVYTLAPPDQAGIPNRPRHLQTMHSDVSFHPAALSLYPSRPENGAASMEWQDGHPLELMYFRVGLTYCTPLYPSSWTVAVQEFGIDLDPTSTGRAARPQSSDGVAGIGGEVWRGECWHVGRGDDDEDDRLVWPRRIRPIVGVKGRQVVGIGTDGRWCVLTGGDNQIQVYSLPTPSPSPPSTSGHASSADGLGLPQLASVMGSALGGEGGFFTRGTSGNTAPIVHSQTLLAHSGEVTSLSLSAGRCVSGGRDGRVLVWELDDDLELGTGAGKVIVDGEESGDEGRVGRTVGYVEVRAGGRRGVWRGAAGPDMSATGGTGKDAVNEEGGDFKLPHPQSISSAARALFLPPPPLGNLSGTSVGKERLAIRHLAFDEEKIVGLVSDPTVGNGGEVLKVWSFSG